MVQLGSKLKIADNSGAKQIKIIQVRGGLKGGTMHKSGSVGDIVIAAITKVSANGAYKDGGKCHAVIVRTHKEIRRSDGTYIRFDDNAAVLIDLKTRNPIGTRIFGPVARELKARGYLKIASLAPEVL